MTRESSSQVKLKSFSKSDSIRAYWKEPSPGELGELAERDGDVDEHDEVGDGDGEDVALGSPGDLVGRRPLGVEGDVHEAGLVRVTLPLLQEFDEGLLPLHHALQVLLDFGVVAQAVVVVQNNLNSNRSWVIF